MGVQAQLQNGNVGLRKKVQQYGPRAVVQSPLPTVALNSQFGQGLHDFGSDGRAAWCWVLLGKEFGRKTVKVVDGARLGRRGDLPAICDPMRADDEDGTGQGIVRAQALPPSLPFQFERVVVYGVHGVAMADEEGGLWVLLHGRIFAALGMGLFFAWR